MRVAPVGAATAIDHHANRSASPGARRAAGFIIGRLLICANR